MALYCRTTMRVAAGAVAAAMAASVRARGSGNRKRMSAAPHKKTGDQIAGHIGQMYFFHQTCHGQTHGHGSSQRQQDIHGYLMVTPST